MASGIPAGVAFVELRLDPKDYLTPAMRESARDAARAAESEIRSGITEGVKSAARGMDKAMNVVGIAAGAAFSKGLADAVNADALRGRLQAQLGLTTKESQRVGALAGKIYSQAYGESMADVNNAIKSVIQNMDGMRTASSKDLEETSKRAIVLADILEEDVGRTTAAISQLMRTGLAKNAEEAFDIITRGAQLGANKSEDLLDTFNEYGTQFRKLGLDGKTALGLITQGLQAGARDSDTMADALKEFSIRAVDMSATSVQAYKDLGINAEQMSLQIAKGGAGASAGLQLVLDRLRAMKDPVARETAAVGLFGTKAEDLGKALYAIDPSTAVQGLGNLRGAADRAGAAMGETAAAQFTAFKRQLQMEVVNVIVNDVLPILKQLQSAFGSLGIDSGTLVQIGLGVTGIAVAWKGVSLAIAAATFQVGRFSIASALAAATTSVIGFTAGLRNANLAFAAGATFSQRLGAAIRGQVTAWRAMAAAQGISTARLILFNTWTKVAGLATRIFAASMAFLNTAFLASPVGWIVLGLVALGAAFVILWKKSETFRNIMIGAWNAIKAGAVALWNGIKAAWDGIWGAIKAAWNFIKPIFNAIKNVVYNVLRVYFIILMNEVKIVWIAIQIAIKVAWAVIKVIFNAIKAAVKTFIIEPFKAMLSATKPIWSALGDAISVVWNKGIKPVFNGLKSALGSIKDAFKTAVEGIRKIWNGLQDIAKKPVNFVIGLYNQGIVRLVNGIAKFAKIDTRLDEIPKFKTGGIMPGYSPGRDSLIAAVSPGEAVMRPEFTRGVGPKMINAWNGIARRFGPEGIRRWFASGGGKLGGEGIGFSRGGVVPGAGRFAGQFALGGIVDGFIKGVKNFTFGNVERVAKNTLDKLLGANVPGAGLFRDAIAAIPSRIKTWVLSWIKKFIGFGGGKGERNALNWARSQNGKPYIWGAAGPGGYDCSGFMGAIENVIRGKSPYSRRYSTFAFQGASAPPGWALRRPAGFRVGVTNAGVGHMAGTLLGKNVEASGGAGVRVGGGARGFNNGLFPMWYGLKADTGGGLAPGWNPPIYNGTGRIEPILNPRQATIAEKALDLAASNGRGGDTIDNRIIVQPRQANFTIQDLEALERKRDALARVGRPK